jgi:hypothetical protein
VTSMAPNDLRYQGNSDAREFGAVIEANGKNSIADRDHSRAAVGRWRGDIIAAR